MLNNLITINKDLYYDVDKGIIGFISINFDSYYKNKFSALVSSNKNIVCLEDSFDINNLQNIIFFGEGKEKINIYINSTNEKSLIKFFSYQDPSDTDNYLNFDLLIDSNINNYFNYYNPDSYLREIFILVINICFGNSITLG